jgi:hypothetical protein
VSIAPAPAFASAGEAVAMVRAGFAYLAAIDPTGLSTDEQAGCLVEMEHADAIGTVARAWMLGAFTAAQGYEGDAARTPRIWLIHKTGVTEGAAAGHVGWARRVAAHPVIAAALAAGDQVTASIGRAICGWTDKLPEDCRDRADAILLGLARAGARQEDLARCAAEIYQRSLPAGDGGGPGGDPEEMFEDRSATVTATFGGAAVLAGNLTPECAALVSTVLDALSARAGAEDTRSREQRYHDALEDAMRRLAASGVLPERAGAPAKVWVHIPLAQLRGTEAGSLLEQQWAAQAAAEWAGHRAATSVTGGDGSAWLDGDAGRGIACDACLVPVVTGHVDPGVLERLVALCVELADHGHGRCQPAAGAPEPGTGTAEPGTGAQGSGTPGGGTAGGGTPDAGTPGSGTAGSGTPEAGPLSGQAREMLRRAIIGAAVDLVSGPGGLASILRTGQLGARLGGPSLPLDVGYSDTIPAGIRHAVLVRSGGQCEWAGGCRVPAAACHVHHVQHKADGGPTSVTQCALLCAFHHLIAVHRWGWTLTLNPDGTTTARSPDGSKVLHSHGPPDRPG